jgi:hypothetical protein
VSTYEQARSGYSLAISNSTETLHEYTARKEYEVLKEVMDLWQSEASLKAED